MPVFAGYLALGVVDPVTSIFTEITGAGGYARQAISLAPDGAGAVGIAADILFPTAIGADWPVTDGYAVYDAATGGNLLMWWSIGRTPPRYGRLGRQWRVDAAKFKLTFPTGSTSHGSPINLGAALVASPVGLLLSGGGGGGAAIDTVTPRAPTPAGAAGSATKASASDHQHPNPDASTNVQTGTAYTVVASDKGLVLDLTNAAAIALSLPNNLPAGFNCGALQGGAGQVIPAPASGATLDAPLNTSGLTLSKSRTRYSQLSLYVRTNTSGTNAEWVVGGDLV